MRSIFHIIILELWLIVTAAIATSDIIKSKSVPSIGVQQQNSLVKAAHEFESEIGSDLEDDLSNQTRPPHSNNWAVLVCTSRFWYNYRHIANTLAMYRTVKRLGIPDSQIILMLADDAACNARNPFAGTVYANANRQTDLYGEQIQVDYKGEEVSVDSFLRLLTGRVHPSTPRSKRLLTDARSNVFVYMTGHGGANFLKFQDHEEISSHDIADAFQTMFTKDRYNELLFMIDTCQANTMYEDLYSPRIFAMGSSEKGENSYSHHNDDDIGVAVADRFTHHVLQFLEQVGSTSNATFEELFSSFTFQDLLSHPGVRSDLFDRPLNETKLTDFFGSNAHVESLQVEIKDETNQQAKELTFENELWTATGKKHQSNDSESITSKLKHSRFQNDLPNRKPSFELNKVHLLGLIGLVVVSWIPIMYI